MHRQVIKSLMERQRENVTGLANRGGIAEGEWTDVMDRLNPRSRANWDNVRQSFRYLRCRLRAEYSGSNTWPDNPLLILAVYPMGHLPTTRPGDPNTPWHISISFYDPLRKPEFVAMEEKYGQTRIVTLEGWIEGSTFRLDLNNCPIGSDPLVQNVHNADPVYGAANLHVSL